ncbi:hypothetical protein [Streptomyces sp. NBC_00887]|uniref:hypothetical protein n=1 Tax=Streptomyces sp. NBC_00887 TaxID=2975859 RepID=UPI00386D4CE0|nr:hypothetical protein OG844_31335 [Streptomyces sp. NBC_00887]
MAAFGVAGVFVFGGCSVQEGVDKRSWSAGEVREAAESALASLEAEPHIPSDPSDDYASQIEADVTGAGEGQGPSYRISVERAGGGHDYEISAGGAGTAFCMHVTEEKSAQGGIFVPGADGGSSSSSTPSPSTT